MSDIPDNLVRRGAFPTSASRPVASPLLPSVVYASADPDMLDAQYNREIAGYTYAREGHPNADALSRRIDALEGAPLPGMIFGSGMAAVTAVVLGLLGAGERVLAGNQLYGRSLRLLGQDLPRFGMAADFVDPTDAGALRAAVRPETRLILVEVVSNPTLRLADMEAILAIGRETGIPVAVDNTFTTPRGYRPFEHGADVVIDSVTKLLAGHSDVTLGYAAVRDPARRQAISDFAVTAGLTPSPFDCWLAERGLMTFHLRYDRAEENARALADFLAGQPGMRRVLYPGRADHPDHNRAQGLLGARTGNMLSFEIEGGRAAANALTRAMPDVPFAPTLGDVSTTLSHPASSSHRGLDTATRTALGISEGFFRISVGVEDIALLKSDFGKGLAAAAGA